MQSGRGPAPSRGCPRGLGALHRRYGRLAWPRLVEPSVRLARRAWTMPGPPTPPACAMLGPVFTMQPDGAAHLRPRPAGCSRPARRSSSLGSRPALEWLAGEGADSVYTGSVAELLTGCRGRAGGPLPTSRATSDAGAAGRGDVARAASAHARRGLSGVAETLDRAAAACADSTLPRRACTRCCSAPPRARRTATRRISSPADSRGRCLRADRRASASARATSSPASTCSSTACSARSTSFARRSRRESEWGA
jgi:hypothetical protein